MDTKNLISLACLLQAIINAVSLSIAQKPGVRINHQSFMCSKKGDLTSSNIVQRERALGTLLNNIKVPMGTEIGDSDGVWSVALCPPNIKLEACRECVNNTDTYIKNECPKQKEGVAWTVLERVICVVRYADYFFHAHLGEWAYATFPSPPNQSPYSPAELEKELNNLANKLKGMVAENV
ncbi:cysteine-rich receptor-like protein kinase 36 [Bidens hawaiensis]|uniref:cysteine-rich receptor-like protein kinase 36 n=1 Tax=Bidens hawaiensis TaxID=980011 RepID=UPI00404AD06E